MCGIAGKVSSGEPVQTDLIERMCHVLRHRGPDALGLWVRGPVGLGIQRLAVIDLVTGDQPITNETGSIAVVLNGEIYNYRELRAQLVEQGHRFSSRSDTEVIVHLYEECGVSCVEHLRGMFAFALWDEDRERLLLARDRLGKKPLFFARRNGNLWFGSEAKALFQDPTLPREPALGGIDAFLQLGYVPHDRCAFTQIEKLAPAHTLTYHRGSIDVQRYWKLSYSRKIVAAEDELTVRLRQELFDATRMRLRSDVPLGIFLSGGVDSSAVLAAAANESATRLKTFTIGFGEPAFDERQYAREMARLFDTEHHELVIHPDILDVLPRVAWHHSEPFGDQSAVPSMYLAEMARSEVTVALSGDGGDESFGGYRRYRANALAETLRRIPAPLRMLALAALERIGPGAHQDNARARSLRILRGSLLDEASRYAMWFSCFGERERRSLYTVEARQRVDEEARDATGPMRKAFAESDAQLLIERLLDVDTQTYLVDQLLVKMDVASMTASLEVRSPLLDHHLMELAARIPLSAKVDGKIPKRLLGRAISPWVPESMLCRPKQGFTMPIAAWLRNELAEIPTALLLSKHSTSRGLFDPLSVKSLIDDHRRGTRDNSVRLWALIQLELWFLTYIDRVPDGPIALDGLITRTP